MTSTAARASPENVTSCFCNLSQLFKVTMLAKCVLTILELNCNQRFRGKKIKLNSCHHVLFGKNCELLWRQTFFSFKALSMQILMMYLIYHARVNCMLIFNKIEMYQKYSCNFLDNKGFNQDAPASHTIARKSR